jgi:hypothetical protein
VLVAAGAGGLIASRARQQDGENASRRLPFSGVAPAAARTRSRSSHVVRDAAAVRGAITSVTCRRTILVRWIVRALRALFRGASGQLA